MGADAGVEVVFFVQLRALLHIVGSAEVAAVVPGHLGAELGHFEVIVVLRFQLAKGHFLDVVVVVAPSVVEAVVVEKHRPADG